MAGMPEERTGAEASRRCRRQRRRWSDEPCFGRGVAGLNEERRQPRQEATTSPAFGKQPVARGLAVRPERPHRLGHQDERRDVVAVHGRDGSEDIKRPPPKPALLEGEEQRQGRKEEEHGDQGVGAGPGRVIDLERAERKPGGGHSSRPPAPRCAARQVDQRHARDARDEEGIRSGIVRSSPRANSHESTNPRRGVFSGSCTTESTAPERVVVDDRVQEQLVVVEAGLNRRPPQDDRQQA